MKTAAWLRRAAAALALLGATHAQAQGQGLHPTDQWEFGVEAGYLAKVKNNSPFSYRIVPVQAVWRTPAFWNIWSAPTGARLTVRHRFSVIAEAIVRGPEDRYLAFAAAPTFELWSADRRTAGFFEIGGGAGFINSQGVAGGQGQDLAFNWFTQGGVRRQLTERMAVTGALYFTHHSNLGMTNPNPGIDVLGVNFGVVWSFR
jgi:hypothetical protein